MTKHRQYQNQKLARAIAHILPCPVTGWNTTIMSRQAFIKICAKKRSERTKEGIRHPQCRDCPTRQAIKQGMEFEPPRRVTFWTKDAFEAECDRHYHQKQEPICQSQDPATTQE